MNFISCSWWLQTALVPNLSIGISYQFIKETLTNSMPLLYLSDIIKCVSVIWLEILVNPTFNVYGSTGHWDCCTTGKAVCSNMTAHLCHDLTKIFFHPHTLFTDSGTSKPWAARTPHVACSLLPVCTLRASTELKAAIFIILKWQNRHPYTGRLNLNK